jgi:hypothetical protein
MADEKDRKKRKPTAAEQAWQKRRAESTAAYNQRKAEREERRAANTDDPERAAAARRAAEMYRARIPVPDNGAAAPAAGGKPGGGNGVPAAGGKPGGGNGVPAAGGVLADNVALQALTAEVANLRNELYRMHGELATLKQRQTYTIKFGEDEGEGGGKDYVAGDDTNIVFTPDGDSIKVDVYYL